MGPKAPTASMVVSYSVEPCDALGRFAGLMAVRWDGRIGVPGVATAAVMGLRLRM